MIKNCKRKVCTVKKQLFFDDNRLFSRDNAERKYGKPVRVAEYIDSVCSTDFCTGWVFKIDGGKYRMLYFAHSEEFKGKKLFCATSDDGINFVPEKLLKNNWYILKFLVFLN